LILEENKSETGKKSPLEIRKKVLIIDDRRENLDVISFFLEAHEIDYKILDNGRIALETIRNEGSTYQLILLDLAMPGFSGIDVFNSLKRDGLIEKMQIVLFTASSVSEEQINGLLNSGAKGIVYKPVSVEDLEKMVERYLKD
jgi:two-component system, OmpR family, response regulator